ncbi:transcription factor bHLH133-like isoform X1 [Mercurialis annua]|uniref:transcription factor bHLH133-like isoform X1 n=1 Tax=Mercurialis annua TaxID=3986 RepID=UPI00215E2214|nr:transcription factor bHLH133-like isoform X1 [Mercurialis annua]
MGKNDHDRCPFLFPPANYGSPPSSPSSTPSSDSSPPPSYSCTYSSSHYSCHSSPSITSPFAYLSTTRPISSTPASPSADCGKHNQLCAEHNYLANNFITEEIRVEGDFEASSIIKSLQDPKEVASLCLVPSQASQGYNDCSTTIYLKRRREGHDESIREGKKKMFQHTFDIVIENPKNDFFRVPSVQMEVPREKLGDKLTILQNIVSPYGKTDTASVLLETIGYIKFLQGQVEILSRHRMTKSGHNVREVAIFGVKFQVDEQVDLRSRGLCLVPISLTISSM